MFQSLSLFRKFSLQTAKSRSRPLLTWLHYPRLGPQVRQVHVGFPAIDDGVGVLTSPFSSSSVSHGDLNGRCRTLDPFPRASRPLQPPELTTRAAPSDGAARLASGPAPTSYPPAGPSGAAEPGSGEGGGRGPSSAAGR